MLQKYRREELNESVSEIDRTSRRSEHEQGVSKQLLLDFTTLVVLPAIGITSLMFEKRENSMLVFLKGSLVKSIRWMLVEKLVGVTRSGFLAKSKH